ncbi:hypothetical protein [Klebsiella aerogenes]|uniref:hypothetical protein n=1 Tax=Klebsiella aerogenes TaxID=548 RepID=UPI000AB9A40C|nr:hypothetical protein [Klebsiella aerogenes]
MKTFKDMTPMQRIAVLRKAEVTVFPKLSQDEKIGVMHVENEPSVSAQKSEYKLALYWSVGGDTTSSTGTLIFVTLTGLHL